MRKEDFPIFKEHPDLTYLDTAATSQRPAAVIAAMTKFMEQENAPIHRGMYPLAEEATARFEAVRKQAAEFIGGNDANEIVFTCNATQGINLVAYAWGRINIEKGDEILLTRMEHHANFVPWLVLAKEKNAKVVIAELTDDGRIDMEDFNKKLSTRTKYVGVTHVSNVLGTVNPIEEIGEIVKDHAAVYLVDAAQSAAHRPIDVKATKCDYLVYSGHKLYGPTGAGVLFGKRELLESMPPFMTGGHMIEAVTDTEATWAMAPGKFEAGSPDSISVVGLGAALKYLSGIGWDAIAEHEGALIREALDRLQEHSSVTVYGPKETKFHSGVIAFTVEGVHPHDVASLLAESGIGVRAGHHCAMPLHTKLGVSATVRLSFGVYTDRTDLDRFFEALENNVLPLAR